MFDNDYEVHFEIRVRKRGEVASTASVAVSELYEGPNPVRYVCARADEELKSFYERFARLDAPPLDAGGTPDFAIKPGE